MRTATRREKDSAAPCGGSKKCGDGECQDERNVTNEVWVVQPHEVWARTVYSTACLNPF